MKVEVRESELLESGAELVAVGLVEGGKLPAALAELPGAEAAAGGFKKRTLLQPEGPAWVLIVGLGKGEELTPERLRVTAALAAKEAARLQVGALAWALPA